MVGANTNDLCCVLYKKSVLVLAPSSEKVKENMLKAQEMKMLHFESV